MSTAQDPPSDISHQTRITSYFHIIDTRTLWTGDGTSPASIGPGTAAAADDRTRLATLAPAALALLSAQERERALAFYFARDAKLSLASSLLKRHVVCKAFSIDEGVRRGDASGDGRLRWGDVRFSRRGVGDEAMKYGKPCVDLSSLFNNVQDHGQEYDLDFNVSHQAGIAVLAAYRFPRHDPRQRICVGLDVTCTSERRERDVASIRAHGWEAFLDVFRDVFSDADIRGMQRPVLPEEEEEAGGEDEGFEWRLRVFYAMWALKEAYVKMEGEALLAGWLREVEFRGVNVPRPSWEWERRTNRGKRGSGGRDDGNGIDAERWGVCVEHIEVWFRGKRRDDVQLFLQSFEDDYLVATAVLKGPDVTKIEPPKFETLESERDIMPLANP